MGRPKGKNITAGEEEVVEAEEVEEKPSVEQVQIEEEPLALEKKVTVKSIAPWTTGFSRRAEGIGDITVAPKGNIRLSRMEIITQVQDGNKLFAGIDGNGNHATYFIDDAATRKELGFDNQVVFSKKLVEKIFEIKDFETFKRELKKFFVTRAEKSILVETMKELNINDYQKIREVENYIGISY